MQDLVVVSSPDPDPPLIERAAHDLLNPVASILGLAETLKARGSALDDATLRSFGDSMSRQSTRLERALKDLVRASRLLREPPRVVIDDVDIAEVAAEAAGERVRVEAGAGSTKADRVLLIDALGRLVQNALDHSSGEVLVRAAPSWFEVTDQGTGFTAEGLAASFEPLAAGTNARGERAGLGLGLFIARRLVEAMGGTLTATSSPGQGSVFRIQLPG